MKLLRIKPGPFHRIGDRYGHLINGDHFLGRDAFEDPWLTRSRANVLKSQTGYTIELTFPGFKREEIHIQISDDVLEVSAKRESKPKDEMIHQELSDERYRTFELPAGIDQNEITAKLENGLLKIKIPHKNHPTHIKSTVKVA